jgi:hypothetical protein
LYATAANTTNATQQTSTICRLRQCRHVAFDAVLTEPSVVPDQVGHQRMKRRPDQDCHQYQYAIENQDGLQDHARIDAPALALQLKQPAQRGEQSGGTEHNAEGHHRSDVPASLLRLKKTSVTDSNGTNVSVD